MAAERLTGTPVFPSGDEPHYLVIAQSLWRDGDLKIENNHARGDYHAYFNGPLSPDHVVPAGADGANKNEPNPAAPQAPEPGPGRGRLRRTGSPTAPSRSWSRIRRAGRCRPTAASHSVVHGR